MNSSSLTIPVSFFGMAVGTLAWGHAWREAATLWHLPQDVVQITSGIGLIIWVFLLLIYGYKWLVYQADARRELSQPMSSIMSTLVMVSSMLAAITLLPLWPALAYIVFAITITGQLLLGLWFVGHLWQGQRPTESVNASLYLPAVAQNLVAATACASFGHPTLAALFFGAGVFSWLALESVIMQRAVTQTSLLPATRPIQGIQIAPPVVAGLSYLALTEGPPDLFIQMLFGYGLYQALLAYRLLHWTCEGGFSAMFWAFSFGAMALTTMSLKLADRAPYVMLWTWLSIVLFVLANAIIALLFWQTYLLARQRRLLVHVDS